MPFPCPELPGGWQSCHVALYRPNLGSLAALNLVWPAEVLDICSDWLVLNDSLIWLLGDFETYLLIWLFWSLAI